MNNRNIMKKTVTVLLIAFFATGLFAQTEGDRDRILYQLDLCKELTEYLDEIFQEFGDGYLDPEPALKKVNTIMHEYNKLARPVPPAAERLDQLTKALLSRVEYYFIYYKRSYRENPEINRQIYESKFELTREIERLEYMYAH